MSVFFHGFQGVFKKFRWSIILSVTGMAMAFTVFLLLLMQVTYEWGFDRFHKHADCLYRLEMIHGDKGAQACLNRPLIEAFASSPHVVRYAFLNGFVDKKWVIVEQEGKREAFNEMFYPVSVDYPDLFDFKMVEGERSALTVQGQVLIPESLARKYFGNSSALGKSLTGEGWHAVVGGVYEDMPDNSIVRNAVYEKIPDYQGTGMWTQNNFECYLQLDKASAAEGLVENFKRNFHHEALTWETMDLRLVALPDVYFETDCSFDSQKEKGSYALLRLLMGIALICVVIAAINFTNFSNSQVPMRVRAINTRKVLGDSVGRIRFLLVTEAVVLCLAAYGLAVLFVYYLSHTSFRDIVVGGLFLQGRFPLFFYSALFVVLVGIVSSYWPAKYITSFPPALVLNGNFGLSLKGKAMRNALVCLQFFVSFVLIIGALFVNLQNRYMLRMPLGFDKEQVVVAENLTPRLQNKPELIRQGLKELPEVEAVSVVSHFIGATENYGRMGRLYKGGMINYLMIQADPSILQVLGIRPQEGRDFQTEDGEGEGVYIFNEMARKQYEMEPGDILSLDMSGSWGEFHVREEIVGFMPDLKYNSFKSMMEPFAFYVGKNKVTGKWDKVMIRTYAGIDYTALKASLNRVFRQIDPDYVPEITLFDEIQNAMYEKELRVGRQVTFFSLVAVLISLMGVLGVVMLDGEYKRKEVGVRKVFGATLLDVLCLFSKTYLRIVALCYAVAVPVAYYAIVQWQESFVYKVPLSWWIFLLAFVIVTAVTLLTVSLQNLRVAGVNPAETFKNEG